MAIHKLAEILGEDLVTRRLVGRLKEVTGADESNPTIFDFTGVNFVSRSFMDEFYNVCLKDGNASATGMRDDFGALLNAVMSTQDRRREPIDLLVYKPKDEAELEEILESPVN